MTVTIKDFWRRVKRGAQDECWEWQASRLPTGYGRCANDGGTAYAHRVAYELAHGEPIPSGLIVRHSCDNPPCCNPAHLLLGTQADNVRDRDERGRTHRVVTPELRVEAVALRKSGLSRREVADRIGVKSPETISRITGPVDAPRTGWREWLCGHPATEENTYRRPNGRPECCACRAVHRRRYREMQEVQAA